MAKATKKNELQRKREQMKEKKKRRVVDSFRPIFMAYVHTEVPLIEMGGCILFYGFVL